jgi:hypothetical protein
MTKPTKPIKKAPAKPAKKKYLNNKDLLREIEKSHQAGKMTNEFALMIKMLCHRYASKGNYASYSYNEDMQAFALLTVCKVWKSFDPVKGKNPFAYFTQTIKHAFFQYLNNEKKQRTIRDELLINNGDNPSFGFLERGEDDEDSYHDSDYHTRVITTTIEVESDEENTYP